jgi:hypothetical protein
MTNKFSVSVWDNTPGKSMKSHNFLEKQICNMCFIASIMAWDIVCHLPKSINNNKYEITSPLGSWQSQHKIHAYCILRPIWNRQWMIQSSVMFISFCIVENITCVHKLLHLCSHTCPIV